LKGSADSPFATDVQWHAERAEALLCESVAGVRCNFVEADRLAQVSLQAAAPLFVNLAKHSADDEGTVGAAVVRRQPEKASGLPTILGEPALTRR